VTACDQALLPVAQSQRYDLALFFAPADIQLKFMQSSLYTAAFMINNCLNAGKCKPASLVDE
jgi:hypothetical protein